MSDLENLLTSAGKSLRSRYEPPVESGEQPLTPPELSIPQHLADVAYTVEPSPLGSLLLAATSRGIVRVAYLDGMQAPENEHAERILEELARAISPRVVRRPTSLDPLRRQLDEFFTGRRRTFDLALDWRLTRGFGQSVLRATAAVPFGEVTTYKRVAGAAGSPRAYRAAGNALGSNPLAIIVPCHRVLHSSGGLGGYTGGTKRKLTLLGLEGFESIESSSRVSRRHD